MEAKEYRVGNYIVDYETEPYFFKIEEIKNNKQGNLSLYYRNGSCWTISPDRIELTEEILLKCGFEYFKSNNSFQLDTKYGFSICGRVDNGFYIYVESDEIGNAFCFLHQLQNLYFALTNEELTINL